MTREMTPAEQALAEGIALTLSEAMRNQDRSKQQQAYIMGVSDLGTCRERARHMVVKTPMDPPREDNRGWPAMVGQAIEAYVLDVLAASDGHLRNGEVTVDLPSGLTLTGHYDWVIVLNNIVIDIKTVDGLEWPRRSGASLQQKFQRRLYAAGLVQAGVLDESRPVLCGNVWFDRSAREQVPWVEIEEYHPHMLNEIDDWLSDVNYAVEHNEQASKDMSYEWCEVACPFFLSCRGGEEHTGGVLEDPDGKVDEAAHMYIEGGRLRKEGDYLQAQAKQVLTELNGATDHHTVKSTWVNEATVPESTRRGFWRLTVREKKA